MLSSPLLAFFFSGPFTVLATAAGAVSIPIVIHLLNRKRFRIVPWAAMRFLLAAQKKNSRRLRLEQLLLLAVRALVVLLLILAMASVTDWAERLWDRHLPDSAGGGGPGGRRTHRILVLDGSLSMGLKAGDTTCFEKARALARRIVTDSVRGDGFSIVLMASSPKRLVGGVGEVGPAEDSAKVLAEIENLRLPHGNSDLAGTLETVFDLLRQSPSKFVDREVVFLTDLQKTSWVLPQPGQVASALQGIQARAHTLVVDVGTDTPPPNRAVTRLVLADDVRAATAAAPTSFVATVHNYGPETPADVAVSLRVGRVPRKAGETFELRDEGSRPQRLAHGPNLVSFRYPFTSPGDYVVQVRVEGDALDLDDARSVVVHVRDRVPVMLVNGKPARSLYDEATEYLNDALDPYDDQPPPPGYPVRTKKRSASDFVDAELGKLADVDASVYGGKAGERLNVDCVFLCDVPSFSAAEVKRLEEHVLRGGGVVFCLGPNVDLKAYNDVLYRNGQGLLPAELRGRQQAPKGYYFHFSADEQSFRQPPLAAFGLERDRVRLLTAPFSEFIRAEVPTAPAGGLPPRKVLSFLGASEKPDQHKPDAPARERPPADASLYLREAALLDWQPPLAHLVPVPKRSLGTSRLGTSRLGTSRLGTEAGRGLITPPNRGRVLLLTTTVNTDWSDWPRQGNFVWLMQEMLAHAASGRLREPALTVGDTLEEYLPPASESEAREVTLQTPDGRTEKVRTVARDGSVVWRFGDTDVSGVYRAAIGQHPHEHAFAVNFPATTPDAQHSESDLTRATADELHKTYPEWEFQVVRDLSEAVRDGKPLLGGDGRGGQNLPQHGSTIARWLLLAVLALLVAEVVLAWYFGHYSAVHSMNKWPVASGQWPVKKETKISVRSFFTGHWPLATGHLFIRVAMGFLLLFSLAAAVALIHAAITGDFLSFLPGSWRAGFERAMDVPAPAAGESSRWKPEFRPFLWSPDADPWLAGVLAVALAALVVFIYRREGRVAGSDATAPPRGSAGRKLVLLVALRLGMFLMMLAVLLPQFRLWFERQSWPDIVLLIDDSGSMGEVDDFRDPRVKEAAERLAGVAHLDRKDRLRLAQALVARPDADWITALLTKRQAKLHVYHCSARAARLASVSRPEEVQNALEAIRGLEAKKEHDSSQLGACVRQVLNDFRGAPPAAIVMLTDGVTTEGEDLGQVARYAAQVKVPLFFIGIGDSQESRDIIVSDLEVAESVFVNDNLIFRVNVAVKGYGDQPAPVKVRLREKGVPVPKRSLGTRETGDLATQTVTPESGGKPTKVRLEYRPTKPGLKEFVVEVDPRPDEVDKENNSVPSQPVFVSEARLLKVLYVEGYGRWEFRYVKALLERESERAQNKKSIDLTVVLADADAEFWEEDKSARKLKGRLPTKDELNRFDVVVLGDFDPAPHDNAATVEQFLKDLADFVRVRGGGLVMVAGERYAPHTYKDSPLRDVLPIDITSDRPPEEPHGGRTESFRPELTPIGRMHPIFSFNEKDPDPVWKKLKEMYWYAEGYQPKRAAEVLAVHPTLKEPGAGSRESKHPLVVQQFVGAGRTLFLGFHETWRWRWREDELRFNQFWVQTVRYLASSRQGRVELRLNKQGKYQRGEEIKFTVRYPDDAPPPAKDTDVRVVVLNKDAKERQTIKLARVDGSRATFEGALTQTPVGRYELWMAQPRVTGPQPRAECKVVAPPGELQQVRMNQAEMEAAARDTHGRFYTLADAEQLLETLPDGPRVTSSAPGPPWLLWNHALLLVVALLFLSVEWIMRKRYHLL